MMNVVAHSSAIGGYCISQNLEIDGDDFDRSVVELAAKEAPRASGVVLGVPRGLQLCWKFREL